MAVVIGFTGVAAARPPAAMLLPADTLVFVAVQDVPALKERFFDSSMGRMSQDPQLRPLLANLYKIGADAFGERLAERAGVSLDELLAIPDGEIAAAIVPIEGQQPGFVLLLDAGKNVAALDRLVERLQAVMAENVGTREEEVLGDLKIVSFRGPRGVSMVRNEDSLVVSSNVAVLKDILARWTIEPIDHLADHRNFKAALARCPNPMDEPPLIVAYADPIGLMRAVANASAGGAVVVAMAPALGLDGLKAAAATYHMAVDEYDSVMQFDLLLDAPRKGVVELVALGSGDNTPERWVPPSAASYSTIHWDVQFTYGKLAALIDGIQGEGAFARLVTDRFLNGLGIDLEQDLLPLVAGRASYAVVMEQPLGPGADAKLFAVQVTDAEAAAALLDHVASRFAERLEPRQFDGVPYYGTIPRENRNPNSPMARINPCAAIVDDYLIVADRETVLKEALAARHEEAAALAVAEDYLLVADKIAELYRVSPSYSSFSRPEEGLRMAYEMAVSQDNRARLHEAAASNELLKRVVDGLDAHPLPPFEVLQRYVAPGGSALTNDASGLHLMSFSLRPPAE